MNNDDGFIMNAINDRVLVLRLIFFFLSNIQFFECANYRLSKI